MRLAGDKLSNLEAAIDMLNALAGRVLETSRLYCTAPQYVEDQPSFFNLVLKLTTTLSPTALLEAFKHIEREIGRVQSFRCVACFESLSSGSASSSNRPLD